MQMTGVQATGFNVVEILKPIGRSADGLLERVI